MPAGVREDLGSHDVVVVCSHVDVPSIVHLIQFRTVVPTSQSLRGRNCDLCGWAWSVERDGLIAVRVELRTYLHHVRLPHFVSCSPALLDALEVMAS